MSAIQHIPLNKLTVSVVNVRRTDRKTDIEGLAASIAAHGLLQNLTVTPLEDDRFAVVAGGRRLAALKLLAKNGDLAKDTAIACQIVSSEAATEASLAENIQRVAMNVMDEVEAFADLVQAGSGASDIAQRFGCSVRHVEQRLALAALSPKIRTAYRKGDVTLDVARAFCLAADHTTQERLFKQMSKPITHAPSVRQALTQGRIPAHDRLAKFVGLQVYEGAGGRLARDLFEEDIVFLNDGDLLHRLAGDKLELLRDELAREGWGWVEIQSAQGHAEGCAAERLRASRKKPSAKQAKAIAALEAEITALDAQLETADDDDALWDSRDAAEAKLSALQDALTFWDKRQMAHAGALIGVDHQGAASITRGLIKRADLKALNKLRNASTADETDEVSDGAVPTSTTEHRLPQVLVERLTTIRTCGLRSEIANDPKAALALLVHCMLERSRGNVRVAGVEIITAPCAFDEQDPLGALLVDLIAHAPLSFDQCLAASSGDLQAWLAILVAETLNLTHRGATGEDSRLQASADAIASAIGLDMTRHWQVDEAFWLKAPKNVALKALEGAPKFAAFSNNERASAFAAFAKMKKADLAKIACSELSAANWLPDLIVTPPRADDLAVTPGGHAAIADFAA